MEYKARKHLVLAIGDPGDGEARCLFCDEKFPDPEEVCDYEAVQAEEVIPHEHSTIREPVRHPAP